MKNRDNFLETFEKYYAKNNEIELALSKLKEEGASQMDCLKVLIKVTGLSLKEADKIILNSKSWSVNKNVNEKFKDDFADFLDEKLEESE